jgi:hypothetical protein
LNRGSLDFPDIPGKATKAARMPKGFDFWQPWAGTITAAG